ncbi:MAG: LamG domain-containing protein [Phycisphaerae bacterium]|nr:LamG domain-containing protein [Phycisphaerae bacterium]
MCKQALYFIVLLFAIVPAALGIVVGDFETGLDGWWSENAALSQSATGATVGASAMQADLSGGWKQAAKLDGKPYMASLGVEGTTISADITVSYIEGGTWMNGQIVINAQNNDNNGPNNNIGWRGLAAQDLVRDGAAHTYKWKLDADLAGDIAQADGSIAWFEIVLVINNDVGDANSLTVNIDNVQINEPTPTMVIGNFESGLDTWAPVNWDAATLTQSTTGATKGSHALQVEHAAGDWHPGAIYNVKPYRSMFGTPGALVAMDVTAFAADMTGSWFNVGMVINAQNNDDNGPHNNIGWVDLGGRDVARDGQPHTVVWELSADLIAKIAMTDDSIGWFEILFVSNTDSPATKFYVDNVRIGPAPQQGAANVFGDWENQDDGWQPITTTIAEVGYTPVFEYSAIGATMNESSLKVTMPNEIYQSNTWWQRVMLIYVRDQAGMEQAFLNSRSMKIDVTRLAADWIPGTETHNQFSLIINCGGPEWSVWQQSGGRGAWNPGMGDRTMTIEWDYSNIIPMIRSDLGFWWFEIEIVAQISRNYTGNKAFYFDNFNFPIMFKAHDPVPGRNATGVDRQTALNWRAGVGAVSHDVFISDDAAALNSVSRDNLANYPQVIYHDTTETTFTPGDLDLSTPYYWRVDEIAISDANEVTITKGDIWSFTVSNNILVEDFESYLDWVDLAAVWSDANDLVTDPVHGGSQAMKIIFDNRVAPYYTEISYAVPAELSDLTQGDVRRMTVYFHGDPNTPAEDMYALLEDGQGRSDVVFYDGDLANLSKEEWQLWDIGLAWFSNVNRKDVVRIAFGFGDPLNPAPGGFDGTVYFDDIRLYQGECLLNLRTADFARIDFAPLGLTAGDCKINTAELMHMAADWLKRDAILPAGTTDPNDAGGRVAHYMLDIGQGSLAVADANDPTPQGTLYNGVTWISPGHDGTGHAVRIDGTANSRIEIGTWDPSQGTGQLTLSLWIRWAGNRSNDHQGIIGKRSGWDATNAMRWFVETDPLGRIALRQHSSAGVDLYSANGVLDPFVGKWAHVAVTFDATTAVIYLNGAQIASGPFALADKADALMGIGATHGGNTSEVFSGDIDEVQIYNRALSALEVAYLADLTPGDGQLVVPIASHADLSSDEPAGQKVINLKDFAVLASYWLQDQTWPY